MSTLSKTAWFVVAALAVAASAHAQDSRYIGRATSSIAADGTPSDEACAGGLDAAGECLSDQKLCDIAVEDCFNESSASGRNTTVGGAPPCVPSQPGPTPVIPPTPAPGFPRVNSVAAGEFIDLVIAQVLTGGASATADACTGALSGSAAPALLTIGGATVPLPVGTTIDLGVLKITTGRTTQSVRDGLSVITVDAMALELPSGSPEQVFGRATAGVELPFTEGGGGGGCSLSRNGKVSGGGMLIGTIALFALLARRRSSSDR